MILTLTIPLIWRLKLKTRQKASLSAVFLLGTLYVYCFPLHPKFENGSFVANQGTVRSACVASIARVITFNQIDFGDVTYTIVDASIWSTIEQSVGIICACLLTYQPLFRRIFSKPRGYSDNPYTGRTPSKAVRMLHLSSESASKGPRDVGNAGFSRLDEEHGLGSSVTTRVTATHRASNEAPAGIVMDQAIEQHHEIIGSAQETRWHPG